MVDLTLTPYQVKNKFESNRSDFHLTATVHKLTEDDLPTNSFVSAFNILIIRVHELILVDSSTHSKNIWNIVFFVFE